MKKSWYQSKTLWFNAICASLTALEAVSGLLQPYVPVNLFLMMSVLLPVGNAFLRVVTSQGLGK